MKQQKTVWQNLQYVFSIYWASLFMYRDICFHIIVLLLHMHVYILKQIRIVQSVMFGK